jgi:cytochrome c oxidase cbb3-type subunit 2
MAINGPDLARVGGKYSDDWHRDHLRDPRAVVPGSIMPRYPWLERTALDGSHLDDHLKTLAMEGVPYSPEMIEKVNDDLRAQTGADDKAIAELQKRYPKAIARDVGGQPTELDALIAYLQRLGTQVDFKLYDDKANIR